MKQKIFLTLMVLFSLVLFSNSVFACVFFPKIETKTNCVISFDYNNYKDESLIISLLDSKKSECGFSTEDIATLKDFVLNGYSVKEQTQEEYRLFLEEAKKQNEKIGCTRYYPAIAYKDTWTGYIYDIKPKDESGNYCPIPTCTGALINIIWNDLIPKKESVKEDNLPNEINEQEIQENKTQIVISHNTKDYSVLYYIGAVVLILFLIISVLRIRKK